MLKVAMAQMVRPYMNLILLSMLQKYIFYYEPAPKRILKMPNCNNSVIIIFFYGIK